MIFVDSSVWIDYFGNAGTPQTLRLDALLGRKEIITGDLVLAEVLQGCRGESDFRNAMSVMNRVGIVGVAGRRGAIESARNYRLLRALGFTVRKTIDSLIATRCILDGHSLLYSDRDFDPFVDHLGLKSAMAQG